MAYQLQYRLLTDPELKEIETQFKHFLIANEVYAEEWRALNAESPDKALELVARFSDVVIQKTLDEAQYMVQRFPNEIRVFQCEAEQISLQGLVLTAPQIDLTQPPYVHDLGQAIREAGLSAVRLFRKSKAYSPDRNQELFRMMERGAEITDKVLFAHLTKLHSA